eukprot:scaffold20556_cov73-Phaeocystis_antarctica.AAC.2
MSGIQDPGSRREHRRNCCACVDTESSGQVPRIRLSSVSWAEARIGQRRCGRADSHWIIRDILEHAPGELGDRIHRSVPAELAAPGTYS